MVTDTDDNPLVQAPDSWHEVRPFRDLQTSGLLWLINTTVLHPRGFALGMVPEEGDDGTGEYRGWVLLGDGTEPWVMPADDTTDELFRRVSELLAPRTA